MLSVSDPMVTGRAPLPVGRGASQHDVVIPLVLLLIPDDEALRQSVAAGLLLSPAWRVATAVSYESAAATLQGERPRVIGTCS